ncbi:hypothetical protein D3C86_1576700 [compost metagenome]
MPVRISFDQEIDRYKKDDVKRKTNQDDAVFLEEEPQLGDWFAEPVKEIPDCHQHNANRIDHFGIRLKVFRLPEIDVKQFRNDVGDSQRNGDQQDRIFFIAVYAQVEQVKKHEFKQTEQYQEYQVRGPDQKRKPGHDIEYDAQDQIIEQHPVYRFQRFVPVNSNTDPDR